MATRNIIVRDQAGNVIGRVSTIYCSWCTDEAVCSACSAKADQLRRDKAPARITAAREARGPAAESKPCAGCLREMTGSIIGLCTDCDPMTRYAYRFGQLQGLVDSFLSGLVPNKKAFAKEYKAMQERWKKK